MKQRSRIKRLVSLVLMAAMIMSLFTVPALGEDYIRTTVDKVNVRETPTGKVLNEKNQIPIGTVLRNYATVQSNGRDWALVQYDGLTGYVDSKCYIACDVDGNAQSQTSSSSSSEVIKTGQYGYVTTDNVLFRVSPSTDSDFWARLPQGWQMMVLGNTTTGKGSKQILWYKVQGGVPDAPKRTYTGYIHSGYFALSSTPAVTETSSASTAASTSSASSTLGYVRTVKTGVNIRKTPNGTALTAKDENKIPVNTTLAYTEGPTRAGDYTWVRVTYKGITGYIRSDCWVLTNSTGSATIATPKITEAPAAAEGTVTLTKGGVNFRLAPNGQILGRLDKGTKLRYYGTQRSGSDDWYYVYSDKFGSYGYVLSTLGKVSGEVSVTPTATPKPGTPTAAPSGTSGTLVTTIDKLFIRKSPSTQATSLTRLEKSGVSMNFTDVRIAGGITWYKVSYNGITGWIHGSYVRITSGGTVVTVTATPTAGTATAVPGTEELSDVALTTSDKVRIRKTASLSGKELTMVAKKGTRLSYLGRYAKDTASVAGQTIIWYNVKYGSVSGWMHGSYVHVLMTTEKKAYIATGDPNARPEAEYRTLSKGDEGDDVTALQQKLVEMGYLASSQVSGKYLSSTEQAVIAFQKAKGLTQDGIAGEKTQHALFNTVPVGTYDGSSTNADLYPVEMVDWFKGDIQQVWSIGVTAVITDVYTGISFKAQRLYGGNHADAEPLTPADTAAYCQIFGVSSSQEISDRYQELQSWRRRPLWVTVGGRTFAASMYGVPHNFSGDRIPDNNFNGQFCVHFVNSMTHDSKTSKAHVDYDSSNNGNFGHQSAIKYAYTHSISGTK